MVWGSNDDAQGRPKRPRVLGMARAIRLMSDVGRPEKDMHLEDFDASLTVWEDTGCKLDLEFGERLPKTMKITVAPSMLAKLVRDFV